MLKIVEYSVAMQNANPHLKEIAKYTTEKNNDEAGVADTIFELLGIHNNQKDEEINRLLINKAIEATKFSYVPYSEFKSRSSASKLKTEKFIQVVILKMLVIHLQTVQNVQQYLKQ